MYRVTKATYQDGMLKPTENLPLEDQEQVLVIVLPLSPVTSSPDSDPKRVTILKEQAATWLSQQPADAVRPPVRLEQAQEKRLNKDFELALAEIRSRVSRLSAKEIAADVSQALVEIRLIDGDERARLEAELDTYLANWPANGE